MIWFYFLLFLFYVIASYMMHWGLIYIFIDVIDKIDYVYHGIDIPDHGWTQHWINQWWFSPLTIYITIFATICAGTTLIILSLVLIREWPIWIYISNIKEAVEDEIFSGLK